MKFKVQIVVMTNDGNTFAQHDVGEIDKNGHTIENIGLTSSESKEILKRSQEIVTTHQVNEFLENKRHCQCCGKPYGKKGKHTIVFRTLFGKLEFESPRLYSCKYAESRSNVASFSPLADLFSERSSPELIFIESKWASYVSYDLAEKIIKDSFPVDDSLNPSSIRNDVMKTAARIEDSLEEEKVFFVDGCPRDWDNLPTPNDPITLGIDGTYLKSWKEKKKNFEVIAGKSIANSDDTKFFGMTRNFDEKPKRRLFDVLKRQGMQENQEVIFLSDGEESIRELQFYLNPNAIYVLDWFHLTMRITVLKQFFKGMRKINKKIADECDELLESVKWNLWHGKVKKATWRLNEIIDEMWYFEENYEKFSSFKRKIFEFDTYVKRNATMIPNYGLAWRSGESISTSFVESTVNSLVNKRFCKKQQMQWSEQGSHMLLQIRVRVLNNELESLFKSWYPDLGQKELNNEDRAAA